MSHVRVCCSSRFYVMFSLVLDSYSDNLWQSIFIYLYHFMDSNKPSCHHVLTHLKENENLSIWVWSVSAQNQTPVAFGADTDKGTDPVIICPVSSTLWVLGCLFFSRTNIRTPLCVNSAGGPVTQQTYCTTSVASTMIVKHFVFFLLVFKSDKNRTRHYKWSLIIDIDQGLGLGLIDLRYTLPF